jgi:hypothetical protein
MLMATVSQVRLLVVRVDIFQTVPATRKRGRKHVMSGLVKPHEKIICRN